MEPIERIEDGEYIIEIHHDSDPESPREWDNLGTMVYCSDRYVLGDKKLSREEIDELISEVEEEGGIILPVYAYIHSGIALNTTGFSCPWDSGQCGFIYATKEDILKEFDVTEISDEIKKKVWKILEGEVETYSHYANGEVYGYQIKSEDEVIESCWGYYDYKHCEEEAHEVVKAFSKTCTTS